MAHNDSFDEPRFEALYRELYPDLLRCAEIALRSGGGWYVSVAGRAEEVVQELQSIIDLPLQLDTTDPVGASGGSLEQRLAHGMAVPSPAL